MLQNNRKKLLSLSGIVMSTLVIFFTNCSSKSSDSTLAVTPTPPLPQTVYTAWEPLLDSEIAGGITTFEGWSTPRFVSAPVNYPQLGGWTDSVTVSRDGLHLFFGYTKNDYSIFETTFALQPTGPSRTSENTTDSFQIFEASLQSTGFSVAYHPVNPGPTVWPASPGVNATQDVMAYTTFQFTPSYRTEILLARKVSGSWQQLGSLAAPVNGLGHCDDDNAFIIGDMNNATIYFESKRTNLAGTTCGSKIRLYYSTVTNGALSPAQEVPGVNGTGSDSTDTDTQIALSENKSTAYWTSIRDNKYGFFTADWNGTTFGNVRPMMLTNTFTPPFLNKIVRLGEPSITELPEGHIMYFMCAIAKEEGPSGPSQIQMRICFSKKPK